MSERCEVVEIRNSADAVGYAYSRTASKECSDCGAVRFTRGKRKATKGRTMLRKCRYNRAIKVEKAI